MDVRDLIERAKRGADAEPAAIRALIDGYVAGDVPDHLLAAWLMAVRLQGLGTTGVQALVDAYLHSGEQIRFARGGPPVVDKHSTGGVGDKLSLIVAPLAAACGLRVAKMSGRALGFTGGTIDKLESIPGLRTEFKPSEFAAQVDRVGLAIAAQSDSLVPADGKIYALRDATGTVDSIPLIAASIVSKKLALETDAVVFDVKVGRGAFMRTLPEGHELAAMMLGLMRAAGRRSRALITRMDEPLGTAIGHSLEVSEALRVLQGKGDEQLRQLAIALTASLIELAGQDGTRTPEQALADGTAYARFTELARAQGGDLAAFESNPPHERFESRTTVRSSRDGFVQGIDAEAVGVAVRRLTSRRGTSGQIDLAVGVELAVKTGAPITEGALLAEIYARDSDAAERAHAEIGAAFEIGETPVKRVPLIREVIDGAPAP